MQHDLQDAIRKIDMEKINQQMRDAMKEFDAEKFQKQLNESIAKVDWEKLNSEIEAVKKIDMSKMEDQMKKVEEQMKKLGPEMEKQMEHAKVEMEKAKKEMEEYKGFINRLDSDGLINQKEDYTIEEKNGELFINGKKQTEQIYNKYRSFLDSHKGVKIEKSKDNFNINRNEDRD
jgi:hypothetical protein